MSEFSIAVNNYEDACELSLILLKNDYVTMISREESLYIVSAIWSQGHADRNDVVFMDKYEFEEKYVEVAENAD